MSTEETETQLQPESNEQTTDQAVETVSPDNDNADSSNDGSDEGGEPEQELDKYSKRRLKDERRWRNLTGKLGERTREVEQLRAELEAERQAKQAGKQSQDNEPDPSQYNDFNAYKKDLLEWDRKQNQSRQTVQNPQVNPAQVEHDEKWAREYNEYLKVDPELKTLQKEDLAFMQNFPDIGMVIEESYDPALLLYVTKHQDEVIADLHGLSPLQIAFEIGKIQASLSKKTITKKTTSAPTPISPVSGNGAKPKKDPKDMNMDDYYNHHLQRRSR